MHAMDRHPDSVVIDALGGTVATSRLCEVSSQAVTQWRRAGIPRPWRMYLRLLRPQVFGEPGLQVADVRPAGALNG